MKRKTIDGSEFPTFSEISSSLPADTSVLQLVWDSVQQDHQKLLDLCEIFHIPRGENQFYELSLALARKLFASPKPSGAKRKWTQGDFARLVIEVETLAKERGRSKSWSYRYLTSKEPYRTLLQRKNGTRPTEINAAATLEKHYKNHKDDPFVMEVKRIMLENALSVSLTQSD